MKCNTVVLISVNEINARKICENIQFTTIENFSNHPEFENVDTSDYLVYNLDTFMYEVNNQYLDVLSEYFITFVNLDYHAN